MKRLITVEEHFASETVTKKIEKLYENDSEKKKKWQMDGARTSELEEKVSSLGADRIAYMDAAGIDIQVIGYARTIPAQIDPQYAVELCREVNHEMYEAAKEYPDRFYCLANLPVSSPQDAAAELEHTVKELGFKGAMIAGIYEGYRLDEDYYLPIYEKAVELDVPIYLHPDFIDPGMRKYYYEGAWSQQTAGLFAGFGIGWHYEVGIQVVRMILSGLFDRLPNLKIIIGHWGEVTAFYMHRLDEIRQSVTGLKKPISDYFKENIYVNPSGLFYEEQFRFCLATFGADHMMWGTDYPYRRFEDVRTVLEDYDISEEDREKIAHGTAERILHLDF